MTDSNAKDSRASRGTGWLPIYRTVTNVTESVVIDSGASRRTYYASTCTRSSVPGAPGGTTHEEAGFPSTVMRC